MRRPPALMRVYVARESRRRVSLWLPLFLLWPIALALGLVWLAIGSVCCVWRRSLAPLTVTWRAVAIACSLPGLRVEIKESGKTAVLLAIS